MISSQNTDSLKSKTLRGVVWTALERLGTQLVGFVVTVVLARLLTPGDYGVVGMLTVFMNVAQMFVDCGFGTALIQKKDRNEDDFATVFWCNLGISLLCYLTLFAAAPAIATFYKQPVLVSLLRVLGLNLILHALYAIQVTRLTAQVQFKPQAKVAVTASVLSGLVGVSLAACGKGPWALVGQSLSCAAVSGVLYWRVTHWHPRFTFSATSFKRLFGFGSKILAASCLHTIYANISPLIVGRVYTAADLGFYTRADSLAALPGGIFQGTLGRVLYPVLSSIQDDETRLRSAYNKYLRLMTSIVAPSMLLLGACAEPVILLLIGEKWLPSVPYLQLLVLGWMLDPVILVNLNVLYVKGRSDLVLKLEIVKKLIAILIVVCAVQYGVIWLCAGRAAYGFVALVLNLLVCGPFIGMGVLRQVREVLPIYLVGFASAAVAMGCVHELLPALGDRGNFIRAFFALAVSASAGSLVYLVLAAFLKFDLVVEGMCLLRTKWFSLGR